MSGSQKKSRRDAQSANPENGTAEVFRARYLGDAEAERVAALLNGPDVREIWTQAYRQIMQNKRRASGATQSSSETKRIRSTGDVANADDSLKTSRLDGE